MPMPDSDDLLGDDPASDELLKAYDRHSAAIYDLICDYMEEAGVNEVYVAQLLIDAMIKMRMTAYGLGVESPSVAGLKLDLDRLRNEVGEFLREAKKGAEEYIGHVKRARAEAEAELEFEEEDEKKPE
jgi:hypothetical protein